MIDRLIAVLGIELDLTGKEIADILWLATQMQEPEIVPVAEPDVIPSPAPIQPTPSQPPPRPAADPPPVEQSQAAEAGIYQPPQRQGAVSQSLTLRVPDARSLREPLLLARSLKPLLQKVAAGWKMTLDETATVQQIAESQVWLPVLKPALEPWLELALVVDESISMQIWQRTIAELQRLLTNYGVFRDVRVWGLVVDEQGVQIRPGLGTHRQALRSPSELIDPSGRRLILVATDCVASSWRSGRVLPALKLWATHSPMAIVQMLPEWLWARTGLGLASAVQFRGLLPGVPNQQLEARDLSPWDEIDLATGIKVPVVTLEPEKFAPWAQMVAGKGGVWTAGVVFEPEPIEPMESRAVAASTAEHRVQQFRVTASPLARRLAGLLASAPVVSLPVVRIIQDRMLPDSRQVHVAEVFLGGLLKPLSEIDAETNPDAVPYEFMEGVRNQLLESVPSSDAVTVLNQVSQFVAERLGLSVSQFAAVLRNPKQAEAQGFTDQSRPFAMVTAQILRGLGGEYAQFAAELESPGGEEGRSESKSAQTNHPDYAYYVGGNLPIEASSYVYRQADRDLYEGLKDGDFCYVLNARQMGKSSLRVRTEERLKAEGFVCAMIDLTYIGSDTTQEQWYSSIIDSLVNSFELYDTFDLHAWWEENHLISPAQKFSKFLKEILLKQVGQSIVIFVDEINSVLDLPFNIDDFFAVIRDCYDNRASQPEYRRLTFALIGVATPAGLIQDKRRTPFNIGRAIELNGFTLHEAEPLLPRLATKAENPQAVLREIIVWTGGQPLLTQKICRLVLASKFPIALGAEAEWVRNLVQQSIIDRWETQDEPEHLKTIRNRILYTSTQRTIRLLGLYQQILPQDGVEANDSPEQMELRLSGLVVRRGNQLQVSNPIYQAVFSPIWVEQTLASMRPYAEAFAAWEKSSGYKSHLLQGQALIDAQAWAVGKTLSDRDYRFLGDSQEQELESRKAVRKTKKKKTTILFLGSNPTNSDRLDLEKEVSEISAELGKSQKRDQFDLKIRMALQPRDIQSALLEFEPQIVHFAGHGVDQAGLVFEDASGQARRVVSGTVLAAVFKLVESFVECVVLSACYSEQQAAAIARYIPYVIGISHEAGNGVAKAFSFGFYNALGAGELYESAYNWGCGNIGMEGFSDSPTPILKRKGEQPRFDFVSGRPSDQESLPPLRSIDIAVPEGSVSTDSPLYIDRPPIEQECYETVLRSGALIRIKSPRQMGKTSLQQRVLHHARENGHKTGYINFQLVDPENLMDLDRFLQWFCQTVTNDLELEDKLADHWKPMLSTKVRCTDYFQQYLLKEIPVSLTLCLDEVDQVFQHSKIAEGFFSLLRAWHEQGKNQEIWKKLRLVIAYSKEIYRTHLTSFIMVK